MRWLSLRIRRLNLSLLQALERAQTQFAIVTNGAGLWPSTVEEAQGVLARRGGGLACYLCDDPFNPAHRSRSWVLGLRHYGLVVSTKRAVIGDLRAIGCKRVEYVPFGFNPVYHRWVDPASRGFPPVDASFAGNADQDRLPIISALVDRAADLRITVYGDGWEAAKSLRAVRRPQVTGLDYAAAMCAATVCPCLVRRANRDGHVMRSFELPAMGAFMLAERTDEHQAMFEEDVHCAFWSSTDELVEKSRWFAAHPHVAREIARRGQAMVLAAPHTYGDRAEQIIRMMHTDAGSCT
jgi:spore maturation protein CgeB